MKAPTSPLAHTPSRQPRRRPVGATLAAAAAGLTLTLAGLAPVAAQDDTAVKPLVLITVDTSGSMEWVTTEDDYPCCYTADNAGDPAGSLPPRCQALPGLDVNGLNRLTNGRANDIANNIGAPPDAFEIGFRDWEKSRAVIAQEVLAGRIENYYCVSRNRTEPPRGIDGNFLRDASGNTLPFPYDDALPASFLRIEPRGARRFRETGLLFLNRDLVRFAYLAFDSDPWGGDGLGLRWDAAEGGLIAETSERPSGSYPLPRPIPGFPTSDFDWSSQEGWKPNDRWNLGARIWSLPGSEVPGGSIPFGNLNDIQAGREASERVERAVEQMVPYGSTPLAAVFRDANAYFAGDLTNLVGQGPGGANANIAEDDLDNCRQRHMIVITDGSPSYDRCFATPAGTDALCDSYKKVYRPTIEELSDLVMTHGVTVHVIGFGNSISSDPCVGSAAVPGGVGNAQSCLDQMGFVGGSRFEPGAALNGNPVPTDGAPEIDGVAGSYAYRATNQQELTRQLTRIFNAINASVSSRTKTASTTRTRNRADAPGLYQFGAAFQIDPGPDPSDPKHLWRGILERQELGCVAANDQDNPDDYGVAMNEPGYAQSRRILSAFRDPRNNVQDVNDSYILKDNKRLIEILDDRGGMTGTLSVNNGDTDDFFAVNALNDPNSPDPIRYEDVVALIKGTAEEREDRVLGDIFHSNPVVVGGPELDLEIPGYRRFANAVNPLIAPRPTMLYVGANDGQLHAFNGEYDFSSNPGPNNALELWSFLPETLRDKVYLQKVTHIFGVDASPVVRDVRLFRGGQGAEVPPEVMALDRAAEDGVALGDFPDIWGTVLVSGLRTGGRAYFALEVGDPTNPRHLWELNPANEVDRIRHRGLSEADQDNALDGVSMLGLSFGDAALGTVVYGAGEGAGGDDRVERGVAIIPGGLNPDSGVTDERDPRFWQGRAIYVVDLATGDILRRFRTAREEGQEVPLRFPVTGSVVAWNDFPGSFITRAFVGDAGGRMLRIDMRSNDPNQWYVQVFHDPVTSLEGFGEDDRRPIFAKPAVSTSPQGEVVLVYGTGDTDDLSRRNQVNYVASISERLNLDAAGNIGDIEPQINWVYELLEPNGEKLTGQPLIYNNTVYFPTFVPDPSVERSATCALGSSRIYALDFIGGGCGEDDPAAGCSDDNRLIGRLSDEDADEEQGVRVDPQGRYFEIEPSTVDGTLRPPVVFGLELVRRPSCDAIEPGPGPGPGPEPGGALELIAQTGAAGAGFGDAPPGGAPPTGSKIKKVRLPLSEPGSAIFPTSWSVILE